MADEKNRTVVMISPDSVVGYLHLASLPPGRFKEAFTEAFNQWATSTRVSDPRDVIWVIGDSTTVYGGFDGTLDRIIDQSFRTVLPSRKCGKTAALEEMDLPPHEVKNVRQASDYLKHDPSKRHSRRGRGRRHERPFE